MNVFHIRITSLGSLSQFGNSAMLDVYLQPLLVRTGAPLSTEKTKNEKSENLQNR
jgi:hypothetical protein